MFDLPSDPIIFAHRGAAAHAPENTLASFELAISQGADAIELDVRISADGRVVVIHDPTVDRTTNGHGRVAQLISSELCSLDAGSFFSEKYRGERIPLLEEVFETVGKKIFINVEFKNPAARHAQLVEKVCALVKQHGLEKRIVFSSLLASDLERQNDYCRKFPAPYSLSKAGWEAGLVRLDSLSGITLPCIRI